MGLRDTSKSSNANAESDVPNRQNANAKTTHSGETRGKAHMARCVSSSYTWYTKATFCDVTSRGTLSCSSATEASAESLA
eukprot:5365055-Prymnesium_polylepis.1